MINSASIASLLRPGLKAIFGDYEQYPEEWKEIFKTFQSDKNFEQEVETKKLGLAQIRAEGAPTAMDTMGERTKATYIHKVISIGFIITKQVLSDNLYKTRFPAEAKSLRHSMTVTKQTLAMSVINNGFNTAYPIGDGQPLFSTQHPTDAGLVANRPSVEADLNEASLEDALIGIRKFKDQAGLPANIKARKLIVAPENMFIAQRLLGSPYRTGTNDNDVSALYQMSSIPDGARVNDFITLPNMWMVLTNCPDGFKHYQRWPLETGVHVDFITDSILNKATERYSFGVSDFRAAYGSMGA